MTGIDDQFTYPMALIKLNIGKKVARAGWNGKGQYVACQHPTESSKMTLPYLYIKTVQGDLVPWFASQTDTLAMDWYEVT